MSDTAYVAETKTKISLAPSRRAIKRAALALAVVLGIAGAADFGHFYLTTGRYLETTDDAYVGADLDDHCGLLLGLLHRRSAGLPSNEPLAGGQAGAAGVIDDRDFRTAETVLPRPMRGLPKSPRNLTAQIELQQPLIQQQAAEVDAAEANLKFAQEERARYDDLMKSGSGTCTARPATDAALRAQYWRTGSGGKAWSDCRQQRGLEATFDPAPARRPRNLIMRVRSKSRRR